MTQEDSTIGGETLTMEWPEDRVALVTMTREREMNTLTLEFLDEMSRACDIALTKKARAMILTGSGRAFCCGAHLRYFTDPDPRIGSSPAELRDNYVGPIVRLFDRLEAMPFPIIAAINGFALGGGFEMSLHCDFRVIAEGAKIGVPEVRLGAIPGAGGVQKLHRFVGRSKALEWILLGSHIGAEEAERFGLVYAIVAPEALLDKALELAGRLKSLSPMAIAQAKAAVNVAGDVDSRSARRFALEALTNLVDSPDWREGMAAFAEKREPNF